jgi:hypothetical protein
MMGKVRTDSKSPEYPTVTACDGSIANGFVISLSQAYQL